MYEPDGRTDGRTDRRTPRDGIRPRLCITSRGKRNWRTQKIRRRESLTFDFKFGGYSGSSDSVGCLARVGSSVLSNDLLDRQTVPCFFLLHDHPIRRNQLCVPFKPVQIWLYRLVKFKFSLSSSTFLGNVLALGYATQHILSRFPSPEIRRVAVWRASGIKVPWMLSLLLLVWLRQAS